MDYKKLKKDFQEKKEKFEKEAGALKDRTPVENAAIVDALKTDSIMNDIDHDQRIKELETKTVLPSGETADRPSAPEVGQAFFDTTLGKAIIYNGSAWVNFDGSALV